MIKHLDILLGAGEIAEFDKEKRKWTIIGATNIKRTDHAVSVINYSDFSKWCINDEQLFS